MIAKAKAISHGINDIRYITGESHNKKHPEKIYRVLNQMQWVSGIPCNLLFPASVR